MTYILKVHMGNTTYVLRTSCLREHMEMKAKLLIRGATCTATIATR